MNVVQLLSGGWHWLSALIAVAAAVGISWFSGRAAGKSAGRAEEQVKAAEDKTAAALSAARNQAQKSEVAKDVQTENAALSDAAARDRLRHSPWNHSDDRDPPNS